MIIVSKPLRSAAPGQPAAGSRMYDVWSTVVLGTLALLAALTYQDYGVTHDEAVHHVYGHHILRFYESGFDDLSALTYRLDYLYGGGFDASAGVFRALVSRWVERYDAVHLFGALVGVTGVAGTWRLARALGGRRVGFIATLMLATTSVYYGHCFNNPKDLPFAVGYVWGLYFLIKLIGEFPRIRRASAMKAAVAFGLALSVRIGGLLLVCYLGLAIVCWCSYHGWVRRSFVSACAVFRRLGPRALAITAGAWSIMLVAWPWALFDPIERPLAALRSMTQFTAHDRWMPFAGREIHSLDPPPEYLLHYFGLKLPEYVVVGFAVASVCAVAFVCTRAFRHQTFARKLALGIFALAIWFPPAYAVLVGSPIYDGLRHFLFLVPPIIVAVALGSDALLTRVENRWGRSGALVSWLVLGALVGDQAATMARLHPHQYVYFNRLVGGVAGAEGRYSTDYYAETYKESAEVLRQTLWDRERYTYLHTVYRVGGCIGKDRASRYLPRNFKWHDPVGGLDFSINYTRGRCADRYGRHPIVARVQRDGGVLNVTYDLRTHLVRRRRTQATATKDAN